MSRNLTRFIAGTLLFGLAALGATTAHAATILISSDITTSQTWTSDNEYQLTQVIYVTSGATLTIEPGTVVRGEPTSGANDPGTLVITRGSKLIAVGTSRQPIVFTNMDDDNVGGNVPVDYDTPQNVLGVTGTWGGLILLGRGYVANNTAAGPNPSREIQVEGLTAVGSLGFYGNCAGGGILPQDCDDDDSGSMSYVSIRYGGFNLSANNEINGLTLGAVGRSTDIDHIEVFQNKDDGIELFGGAVNLKYIIMADGGDDGLDYDEGWRGKVQFMFVMQGTPGTDKSDKGGEHDGGNGPDTSQPRSIPTICNATFVGLGQKSYTAKLTNTGLHFRDNGAGRYYNSFWADFGGDAMLIEGSTSPGSPTGPGTSGERAITDYVPGTGNCSVTTGTACALDTDCPGGEVCVKHYQQADSAFQLELQDNDFWCLGRQELLAGPSFPTFADRPVGVLPTKGVCITAGTDCWKNADCPGSETCEDAPIAYGGDADKNHYDNGAFTNLALDNDYYACATPLPIQGLTRIPAPGGAGVPDPIVAIDPRPATGSSLNVTDRSCAGDGFFVPAPYKGAFAPGANWAEGWTNMYRLGFFPPKPQVLIGADITTSQTWTADKVYVLDKPIYVTGGSTLTIQPGTVVRGQPNSAIGVNDPGTLIITRGSKIQAVGNADNPIVFTNLDDNNVQGFGGTEPYDNPANALAITGTWGGVILLGRGYVANNTAAGPDPAREFQIEGLTAVGSLGFYGNCLGGGILPQDCDDDDSGSLSYVSIRYGGFNLSANNEINGLTLGGVGRSTDIDHIDVYQNKDDMIELFGGAVNLKYLVLTSGGDDSLDYDEGWRGKIQFLLALQGTPGTDKSDKGGEHDGGNNPDSSQPRSNPTIYNATYVGLGQKSYTAKSTNTALHFRDNGAGRYYNSFFGDFGGDAMLIEGSTAPGSPTGPSTSGERAITDYVPGTGNCSVTTGTACAVNTDCSGGEVCVKHYQQVDSAFQLELQDNDFWCLGRQELLAGPSFPTFADRPVGVLPTKGVCITAGTDCWKNTDCPGSETCEDAPIAYGGDADKNHYDNGAFTNAALDNHYFACATPTPIREITRFSVGGSVPDPVLSFDPRPAPGSPLRTTNRTPPADGFFEPAPFKGAIPPGNNWAQCWSTPSRLGLFPHCSASHPLAVPNEVGPVAVSGAGSTGLSWTAPPPALGVQFFDVLRKTGTTSAASNDFTGSICLESDDYDDTAAADSAVPLVGQVYFYAVRAGNPCGEGSLGFYSNGTERPARSCP